MVSGTTHVRPRDGSGPASPWMCGLTHYDSCLPATAKQTQGNSFLRALRNHLLHVLTSVSGAACLPVRWWHTRVDRLPVSPSPRLPVSPSPRLPVSRLMGQVPVLLLESHGLLVGQVPTPGQSLGCWMTARL